LISTDHFSDLFAVSLKATHVEVVDDFFKSSFSARPMVSWEPPDHKEFVTGLNFARPGGIVLKGLRPR
jgi:hypothetical protein